INCLLAAFNLMPIPPLDGSSIIAYFFPGYRNVLAGQLGFIVLLAVMFVPIGNSSLLSILINPLIYAFSWLSQLGGLI
ncbi:MAG: hypothetical protein WCG94_06800, partial [Methanothrix sp.]